MADNSNENDTFLAAIRSVLDLKMFPKQIQSNVNVGFSG